MEQNNATVDIIEDDVGLMKERKKTKEKTKTKVPTNRNIFITPKTRQIAAKDSICLSNKEFDLYRREKTHWGLTIMVDKKPNPTKYFHLPIRL